MEVVRARKKLINHIQQILTKLHKQEQQNIFLEQDNI